MCGIAGFVNSKRGVVDPGLLSRMITSIRHRGPDDTGIFHDTEAGLAHARLSIIDVEGGRQPMSSTDGRFHISFNGEIFNYVELREELVKIGHTFLTRSDTEVLLHLYQEYGENCVQRLNGQWAFAIWDATRRKLFLSRDRMGVRPLFYTQAHGAFLFASEIKALFECPEVPRELNFAALDQIFTFWVILAPRTFFMNIWQLPPGHSLTLENGVVRTWQYWKLEYAPSEDRTDEGAKRLTEELLALLLDATRIRLRSDVPVGAYLSGGLDSTLITALVKQFVGNNLKTFSVSFQDPEFDESSYQQEASRYLQTRHSVVNCTYEDIASIFPGVVWHSEQPILRTAPAPLYLLAKLVRESGFKVVLTGEGSDEVFGGYDIFKEAKIRRFWARNLNSPWRPLLLKRLYPYLGDIQQQSPAYLKNFFHVTAGELASPFFSHLPRWELTSKLRMLLSQEALDAVAITPALAALEQSLPPGFTSWDAFNQVEYLESTYLLPGYILSSQGDRMAMASAVEGRYPFLDYRVVEFGARLPPALKMKVLDEKHLLRNVAKGFVPDSIQRRHKQPYRAPDGKSFVTKKWDYVEEVLSPEKVRKSSIFNPHAVAALLAKFKSGRPTSTKDNMALVGVISTQMIIEMFVNRRGVTETCETHPHHQSAENIYSFPHRGAPCGYA
jgi:asparagine synthase (glutamine-hydrolysing)